MLFEVPSIEMNPSESVNKYVNQKKVTRNKS